MNTGTAFCCSNRSSCLYWPLKDPFLTCFWRTDGGYVINIKSAQVTAFFCTEFPFLLSTDSVFLLSCGGVVTKTKKGNFGRYLLIWWSQTVETSISLRLTLKRMLGQNEDYRLCCPYTGSALGDPSLCGQYGQEERLQQAKLDYCFKTGLKNSEPIFW